MLSLEYIAGLVDGEGCIGIINRTVKGRMLDPYLHINICHEGILLQVKEALGVGAIYKESRQSKGGLDCYLYACCSRLTIITALTKLLPFLIVKKPQAEIVLKFCLNRKANYSYTKEEYQLWRDQATLQHKRNHSTKSPPNFT